MVCELSPSDRSSRCLINNPRKCPRTLTRGTFLSGHRRRRDDWYHSSDATSGGISLRSDPVVNVGASLQDASAKSEAAGSGTEVTPVAQRGDRGADEVRCLGDRQ